jgi:hypothetical protein
MKLDIHQAGESTELEIPDGLVTVGGDPSDTVRIEGLPPRVLELAVTGAHVKLCPREVLTVDDVLVPRNVSRLLLPGEKVSLSDDVVLRVVPPSKEAPFPGTAAVLKQLLSGPAHLTATKAAGFTCLTGRDMGRRFFITGDRCLIGRATDAKVNLRDRAVSRHHARIRKGREGYYVEDLGSPNGLFVNGTRLRTIRILNEGDILEVGRSLLRYTGPAPEASQPSPPPRPSSSWSGRLSLRRLPWGAWLRTDWALIGMGAALAVAGLMVTWGFAA